MQFLFKLLSSFILIQYALSVDKGNFKTCSESGFCKRQRGYKPDLTPYEALLETSSLDNGQFTCQIVNLENDVLFKLELFFLRDNTFRLKLDELNPLKKRYEVEHALVGEPVKTKITLVRKDANQVELKSESKIKVILNAKPFKLELFSNDVLIALINSKNLLKFEHLRTREAKQENSNETVVEEPDMWEETYKSHHDSKPNGPESVGLDVVFNDFENVYGIPEHADSFALKSTNNDEPYRLFNLDVFEYELNSRMALYGSIPFMMAHNEQSTVGLLWLNSAETWIDIKSSAADKVTDFITKSNDVNQVETHWMSESGIIDMFFMFGPTPLDIFRQYGLLTGTTNLPPLFSIAYHQCRWNYNDDKDVRSVNFGFEEHQIPYDVIWLDIEHTDGKKYFTWDAIKFPNSVDTINHISSFGRKMVTIIDPHIKVDNNYKIYSEAKAADYFMKDKNDNSMEGWCWPGTSSWLDFFNPEVRKWYASKFLLSEYQGSTLDLYTWNDMNEMSVFNGPEITCLKDSKHYGGWENRHVHNLYGMLQALSTYEGHLMRSNGERRPFILSRAFFVGSQRAGSIWTGDNMAEWDHLKISVPMLLSLSISGIAHCGADVGGFFKNPDAELLVRWYQAGAYQPFFRAHAHIDTKRREPWLFDDQTTSIIRDAIHARYSLLYYWYTLFYKTEKTGVSPMLPLWAIFPKDKNVFTMEDQYMIGSSLLVKPITTAGATSIDVYFPGNDDIWYDPKSLKSFNGGSKTTLVDLTLASMPVFQRGGSIIPYKFRFRRSSTQMADDPFTLLVALDKNNEANGELYFDDGLTFGYRKNREFVHRLFQFKNNVLKSIDLDPTSKMNTYAWVERVIFYGFNTKPNTVVIESEGKSVRLAYTYDEKAKVLLIRKPGEKINKDWSITIS